MSRVNYFEVNADQPERAMRFYKEVFGWRFERWKGPFEYYLAKTGEKEEQGIDGGIVRRTDPRATVVNYIEVDDVEELVRKIVTHGGSVVQPPTAVPGVGRMVMFHDTEGNIFGAMQEDESTR